MTSVERFNECRRRLWKLLSRVDFSGGCKSYEGAIELHYDYPNWFESTGDIPDYESVVITLHCYVLGPTRHYDFRGKTLNETVRQFDEWLLEREAEMRMNDFVYK